MTYCLFLFFFFLWRVVVYVQAYNKVSRVNSTEIVFDVRRPVSGVRIRSLSIDDGDGSENATFKMNSRFFQTLTRLFQCAENVKCRRISLEMVSWGPLSSLERERKIRRHLFTSSIKRKSRRFHVLVVQWRQRNVQKSVMHVLFCQSKPTAFLTF